MLLGKVIQHGLAAAGRFLSPSIEISDLPGGLAGLLTETSSLGANVIDLQHERVSPSLSMHEVEVVVQLETRSQQHAEAVVAGLRDAGYLVAD